jgi:predicted dehydrogenase
MPEPIRTAFLGCGFITAIHSRHLRGLGRETVRSYASRDRAKAEEYRRRFGGAKAYADYASAIDDPAVDAVVVAVPPKFHLELTLHALERGKHVLVEKPAFPRMEDYRAAIAARDTARRTVLVGENDHYKPLAAMLRSMLASGTIGELVLAHFMTIAKRLKDADDWRNDEDVAGGDAFFEEGIHWLHFANSLGPRISAIHGYRPARPSPSASDPDRRAKTMLVSFQYDNGAAGSLYYSREVPSLFRGLRLSKLFGRNGVITFESNGLIVYARGRGLPRLMIPGLRDIRGYRAMYRDFIRAIRTGAAPEMSLERAVEDQRLMDRLYATIGQ